MKKNGVVIIGAVLVVVILVGTLLMYEPQRASATIGTTVELINGLNAGALVGLAEGLLEDPEAGRVTFYSRSQWQDGMRVFTNFSGYKVDGKMMHQNKRHFVLLGDEGTEIGGSDTAPGAIEELMYAMGTCMIAAGNANAAMMGVNLDRFEVTIESDIDLHGMFALNESVRPGIQNLRARFTIAGDADDETLRKIALAGYKYSPVSETVRNGISFEPQITVIN